MLILGHRYGHQPDGTPDDPSITQLEFRRAGAARIPRVALLRTSIPDPSLSDVDNPERYRLVTAFRAEVQREVRAAEFSDLQGLVHYLSAGVQHALEERAGSGHFFEQWLDAHLQGMADQLATHLARSALRPGTSPSPVYMDLLVRPRQTDKAETGAEETVPRTPGRPLEEVVTSGQSPMLLIGEGGAGKTTSLLHTAARMAEQARGDARASIPIYVDLAKLTTLGDVSDLQRLSDDKDGSWHAWVMAGPWRQMVEMALLWSSEAVRGAPTEALRALGTGSTATAVAGGLGHTSVEVRIAAAEALVRMETESHYAQVAGAMREVIDNSSVTDLRRRAGAVLARIRGATDPFHQPIQSALLSGDCDEALRLVNAAVDIFPADVGLFWWRGHALRRLGKLADAAQSFAHAAELMQGAAVIPQALAEVFLDLREYERARESARRSVDLAPYDADVQATMALSCYKAGAYSEAGQAAARQSVGGRSERLD